MPSRLRKNDEKLICAPMIIRVEAWVAGRIALSAPIPLRSHPIRILASSTNPASNNAVPDDQPAFQAEVALEGFEDPIGGIQSRSVTVRFGEQSRHHRLETQNRHQAADDHVVIVEGHLRDRRGSGAEQISGIKPSSMQIVPGTTNS